MTKRLIGGVICTLRMIAIGDFRLFASPVVRFQGLTHPGLELIAANDGRFEPLITSLVSPAAISKLRPMLPYSFLLKNNTPVPIFAIAVRWELSSNGGTPKPHSKLLQTVYNDPSLMQMPGDYVLMAPKVGTSRRFRPGVEPQGLKSDLTPWNYESEYLKQEKITVVVDLVAFLDGSAYGPNKGMKLEMLNARLEGERTFFASLLNAPLGELRTFLVDASSSPAHPRSSAMTYAELVIERRKELGAFLLTMLDRQGESKIVEIAKAPRSYVPLLTKK